MSYFVLKACIRLEVKFMVSSTGERPPLWSEFLAIDTEVPGSIPGATRFSE